MSSNYLLGSTDYTLAARDATLQARDRAEEWARNVSSRNRESSSSQSEYYNDPNINVTTGDLNYSLIKYGDSRKDIFSGNNQNDVFVAGDGDDTLTGGRGDDTLLGQNGNDVLEGNQGNDILGGGYGSDFLDGGEGDDFLVGNEGNDILNGSWGDDTLLGYGGDLFEKDILNGSFGYDLFYLGTGSNVFYDRVGNFDFAVIELFDPLNDRIVLAKDANVNYTISSGDYYTPRFLNSTTDTALFADGDLIAILDGVSTLSYSSIVFG